MWKKQKGHMRRLEGAGWNYWKGDRVPGVAMCLAVVGDDVGPDIRAEVAHLTAVGSVGGSVDGQVLPETGRRRHLNLILSCKNRLILTSFSHMAHVVRHTACLTFEWHFV